MSTSVMKRLTVWACADDADEISRRLIKLRCVDVDIAEVQGGEGLVRYDSSARIRECEAELGRIESAMSPLHRYSNRKGGLIKSPIRTDKDMFAQNLDGRRDDAEASVAEVERIKVRLSEIQHEISDAELKISSAKPWFGCGIVLGTRETEKTKIVFGTLPSSIASDGDGLEQRLDGLAVAWRTVSGNGSLSYMIFAAVNSDASELLRRLNSAGFVRAEFSDNCGSAEDLVAQTTEKRKQLIIERQSLEKRLSQIAEKLDELEILWDTVSTELVGERVKEKLAATERCVTLEGWVPEKRAEAVSAVLDSLECAYSMTEPQEGDKVPVKLENNRFAGSFEWVVGMYSLPAYGTFDPTFIMSFFYIIFFAMMFADVGYGLLLAVGGLLLPKILKMKPEKAAPFNMFGYCGIGSMITGVLFGGYFGDMPLALARAFNPEAELPKTLALIVDPVSDPMTFLVIGLVLGFIHLVVGQMIQFGIVWKSSPIDAICDYALFWLLYAGIIMLILAPDIGKWVAIAAVVLIVLTGGRKEKNIFMRIPKGILALYGLVGFGSDVLSYSRILALALSGSVLAQVINILGTMASNPIAIAIGMLLVSLIGHSINLALSVLGSFVHTSRLQYIEFFGKFYIDGGKPYAPAEPSEKYSEG